MSSKTHNEKLWERVDYWKEQLKDCENYPVLDGLENSWLYGHHDDEEMLRSDTHVADNPIAAVMYYIDMGFYPPPELMLTMLDCYENYKAGVGDLETIFFGKSVQRVGNYAAQKRKRLRDMQIAWAFDTLLRQGLSRSAAAEKVVVHLGLDIDADSVLRMLRGFDGFKVSKQAEK